MRRLAGIQKWLDRKKWETLEDEYLGEDQFYLERELKGIEFDLTKTTIGKPMEKDLLTEIAGGTEDFQRIGRNIRIKEINVQGLIQQDSATASTENWDQVVCMIVVDTQTNKSAFTPLTMLVEDTFDSYMVLANESRFDVLWRGVYTLSVKGGTITTTGVLISNDPPVIIDHGGDIIWGADSKHLNVNLDVDIPITYTSGGSTFADHTSNSIWWVMLSAEGRCSMKASAQVRYED